MRSIISALLVVLVAILASVKSKDVDLTKIKWAHGVSNQSELMAALNSNVAMIEADCYFNDEKVIIAKWPNTKSDLTLEGFMEQVGVFNKYNSPAKVVKLDFKDIEAMKRADVIIKDEKYIQIWVHADILTGPVKADPSVIVVKDFIEKFKVIAIVNTISLGWTTKWEEPYTGSYSKEQLNEMSAKVPKSEQPKPITISVRAGIIANSVAKDVLTMLDESPKPTLTIWSAVGDKVDVPKLRELITVVGPNRIYVDVPEELYEKLFPKPPTPTTTPKPNNATRLPMNGTLLGLITLLATYLAGNL